MSPPGLRVSTLLPSFCRLILDVGNFLNYVSKDFPKDGILLTQKHAALMQSEEL